MAAKQIDNAAAWDTSLKRTKEKNLLEDTTIRVSQNRVGDWIVGDRMIPREALKDFQSKFTTETQSEVTDLGDKPAAVVREYMIIACGGRESHVATQIPDLDPKLLRYQSKVIGFNEKGRRRQCVISTVSDDVFEGRVPTQREWDFMRCTSHTVTAEDEPQILLDGSEPDWSPVPSQNGWKDILARKLIYPVEYKGGWTYKLVENIEARDCDYIYDVDLPGRNPLILLASNEKVLTITRDKDAASAGSSSRKKGADPYLQRHWN